jgi:hypothetical protein
MRDVPTLTLDHALRDGVIVAGRWLDRYDVWDRPPIGPPLAGSRATAGGRGHRRSQSAEAREQRRALATRALWLRLVEGRSIRDVATQLGISRTVAGRWLRGAYPRTVASRPHPRYGAGLPRGRHIPFSGGMRDMYRVDADGFCWPVTLCPPTEECGS